MKTKSKSKPVNQVITPNDLTAKEKKEIEEIDASLKANMPAVRAAINKLYGDKG